MTTDIPRVQPDSFLTLQYRLSGGAGDVINTFGGQPATLSMGMGTLSQPLEQCLLGLPEGARQTFTLPAGVAFGARNPAMQQWLARSVLDQMGDPAEHYAVGEVVQFPTPDGQHRFAGVVLQHADDGAVQFDFNHPLAGEAVEFEVLLFAVL